MKGEEYLLKYLTNEELKEAYNESINYEDGFGTNKKYKILTKIRDTLKEKYTYKRWHTREIPNLVYEEIVRRTVDML